MPGAEPIDRGSDVAAIQHGKHGFERRSFVAWSRLNVDGNNPLRLFDRVQQQFYPSLISRQFPAPGAGRSNVNAEMLGRPFDRRVIQSSFDHLASQPVGVLTNCWVRHELMLVRAVSLDLLSNVFVEMSEPFVRHMFDAHGQLPIQLNATCLLAWRSQFAGEPANGISLQRIYGKGNFFNAMTGAALESPLLKAAFAGRNSSQSHPVFAGETHWPFNNGR